MTDDVLWKAQRELIVFRHGELVLKESNKLCSHTHTQLTETDMEQIALYKEFRIRAYQDWSGQWLAEAKKPFDPAPEYIATPFSHPTPQAAIDLIKQMVDSSSTTINGPKMIQ
jgi:hypothetical protein